MQLPNSAAPGRNHGPALAGIVLATTLVIEVLLGDQLEPRTLTDGGLGMWWSHCVLWPVGYSLSGVLMFCGWGSNLTHADEPDWRSTAWTSGWLLAAMFGGIVAVLAYLGVWADARPVRVGASYLGFMASTHLPSPGLSWWAWALMESVPRGLTQLLVASVVLRRMWPEARS